MRSSRQRQFLRLLRRTVFALALISSPLVAESRVILISPHNEAIRYEFGRGFDEWHRKRFGEGAAVEWRDAGGTADALRFVQSEFVTKPDGIGIDIFFGGGSEPFLLLADKQLALPYQPPKEILSGIPQSLNGIELYDAGHAWYGAALSSFGILQNRLLQQRLKLPFVTRWGELARPELYRWGGIGDPRKRRTMINRFQAFLQACRRGPGGRVLARVAGHAPRIG